MDNEIKYIIDGKSASKQEFESSKKDLDIEERFLEGVMPNGFIQIHKAVHMENKKEYEYSLKNAGDKVTYEIRKIGDVSKKGT